MKRTITKITVLIVCLGLTGCLLKPYVPPVQQGNIINQSAINKLHYGMNKEQVYSLLGEPILINVFNNDYWTYVYTKQVNGGKITKKSFDLNFRGNKLVTINDEPAPLKGKGPVSF
jgi:outer membrane protein assembly factor BamE